MTETLIAENYLDSLFKETHAYKTYLGKNSICVSSRDGTAFLTGSVEDETQKRIAEHIAEDLPGIEIVDNCLEVTGAQDSTFHDLWIGSSIRVMLLLHRNVSAGKTEVSVNDGIVTLRGEASSSEQKHLTADYAAGVHGVTDVINEMIVVESAPDKTLRETIDDAAITAQVKLSLLLHRSTSAVNTAVETDGGVVTLSGPAENAAVRDFAVHLARDIEGVKSVVNNMTIAKPASRAL